MEFDVRRAAADEHSWSQFRNLRTQERKIPPRSRAAKQPFTSSSHRNRRKAACKLRSCTFISRVDIPVKKNSALLILCSVVLWTLPGLAQTFEVNGQQSQPSANSPNGKQPRAKKNSQGAAAPSSSDNGIGWGSSIEVGRLARAAEDSLHRGNYAQAADYAQRAVNAAPGDNKLWFLLGYASRMAGRYPQSVEAYQHGLQNSPGNPD